MECQRYPRLARKKPHMCSNTLIQFGAAPVCHRWCAWYAEMKTSGWNPKHQSVKGTQKVASITKHKTGHKTIQFRSPDGKRKSIRLGKMPLRIAEALKVKVEQLVAAQITGHAPDDETARWVANLESTMSGKLEAAGLIVQREKATLGGFLDRYIEQRTDVKKSTVITYANTRRNLVEFFGRDKPLRDITLGDADEWRLSLISSGLAENTVRRRSGIAKQFFTTAVRRKLVESNPFVDLKAAVQANVSRFHFVKPEDAQLVMAACPDAEWRLLFALSRYGGLRCPSEHLSLRWGDIDWERGRINVRSPKTEHHPGGESRIIPLFPELKPHLEECFELAEPGDEFVISRYRDMNANLRTQLNRIIKRAGLKPWPKLFQNLRSTRETELAERFPMHVVCQWIGNSQAIAAKHYLQVTDEHNERALQNPVQQPAASSRKGLQADSAAHKETPVLQGYAAECDAVPISGVGDTGLEPVTSRM